MILIVMTGLCTELHEIKCQIILSGDIKQLDAVTQSVYAVRFGFKKSYMERLCEKMCYLGNNSMLKVTLLKNYRSHPDILRISSQFFYDSKLVSKATKGKRHMNWLGENCFFYKD